MKTGIACDWCETSAAVLEVWPAANSAYCFYCSVARKKRECDLMIERLVRVSPRVKNSAPTSANVSSLVSAEGLEMRLVF
jgi:hypothetical protein